MFSKTWARKRHIVTNIDVPRKKFKVWLRYGKYRIPYVSNTISWRREVIPSLGPVTMFKFNLNNSWEKLAKFVEYCEEGATVLTFIFYEWVNKIKIKDMFLEETCNLGNKTEFVFGRCVQEL